MTRIDTSHHTRSLDLLTTAGAPGSFDEALGWVFPLVLPPSADGSSARTVHATATFDTVGHWRSDRLFAWVRTLRLQLTVSTDVDEVTSIAHVDVPWMCDASTQQAAEDLGNGHAVGAHDGLYIGRPLVPLVHNARRPGIWIEHRPSGPRRVIIPNIGPSVQFAWAGRQPSAAIGSRALTSLHSGHSSSVQLVRFLDRYVLQPHGGPLVMSAELAARVGAMLEGVTTFDAIDPEVFSGFVPADGHHDEARAETSPDRREFRLYGDLVRRNVVESLRRAVIRWADEQRDPGRLGAVAARAVQSRLDEFVSPSGQHGGVVRTDQDLSTLSRLELRRTVTQMGPHGTPDLRGGRTWLRGLHPEFRGVLCPLLSPENEQLGLIRGLTIGALLDADGVPSIGPITDGRLDELSASASLVPFLNHDDPTRGFMGAKNLRQAVPLARPEPPVVRSGSEGWIAEFGTVRSPVDGRVLEVQPDAVVIESDDGDRVRIGVGPGLPSTSATGALWRSVVGVGDVVDRHDVLAIAPDVVLEDGSPVLALGANVLTALAVWHGWNFEDGIVVSRSMTRRFASVHLVTWRERLELRESELELPTFELSIDLGSAGSAGEVIGWMYLGSDPVREVVFPEDGVLTECVIDHGELCLQVEVHRPLEVGDKLTTRHGGKGVVAVVVEDDKMPRLPDGTSIEMILNPLSIARRIAVGQFVEIHHGLLQTLTGVSHVDVGRQHPDVNDLLATLAALGADGGRLPLTVDGAPFGPAEGVVVGPMYMVKLDHLARTKARARRRGSVSPVDQQPSKQVTWFAGRRTGAAQRVGEMETWAFTATNALALIGDAQHRSDGGSGSLMSVCAHLRVAGILLHDEPSAGGTLRSLRFEHLAGLLDFDPSAFGGDRNSVSWKNPLHDDRHGRLEPEVRCSCSAVSERGATCATCRTVARSMPSPERAEFRFAVDLVQPVAHPWNPDVEVESVPILPPVFRRQTHDSLDGAYERLIRFNAWLRDRGEASSVDLAHLRELVVAVLGNPWDEPSAGTIAGRLGGKRGLLRRSLRGRNTDRSARLVLSPDPTIAVDEIVLPAQLFDMLEIPEHPLSDLDRIVMLNRPPTLRPSAFVALKARLGDGLTARIHPYLCGLIAGDFDGDEGTIHRPLSVDDRQVAWEHHGPGAAFRSAANGELLGSFDHEIGLGLARLGRTVDPGIRADQGALRTVGTVQADAFAAATGCSLGLADFLRESGPMVEALGAGAIGDARSVGQIRTARGAGGVDFYGVETPEIHASFAQGLSDDDYFATAPASLRKLSEKKLVTPLAGGITKMITEMVYDVVIGVEHCGRSSDHPLRIVTCESASGSICQHCFGPLPSTGLPPMIGQHVGTLSASMIGERTTQAAMKTHGGGGRQSVADRVRPLAALFGRGSVEFTGVEPRRLSVSRALAELEHHVDDLVELRDRFAESLNVDGQHIEVVWRRLREAGSVGTAQLTGDPLVDASAWGRLEGIVEAASLGWQGVVERRGRAAIIGGVE